MLQGLGIAGMEERYLPHSGNSLNTGSKQPGAM